MSRHLALLLIACSFVACGASGKPCMSLGAATIPAGAQRLQLDVFDSIGCAGDNVGEGAGPPLLTRSFAPDASITVAIAPGSHTVLLTVFGDDAGAIVLGRGCVLTTFAPGAQVCLPLTLSTFGDGGMQSSDGPAGSDGASPADLGASDMAPPRCGPNGECPSSKPTCCDGECVQTDDDARHCSACGKVCSAALPSCCHAACINPKVDSTNCGGCDRPCSASATAGLACNFGLCSPTCDPGFADCTQPAYPDADDGCESNRATDHQHSNGLGQMYFDCAPLGIPFNAATYSVELANAAAAAWAATGRSSTFDCNGGSCVARSNSTDACAVFCYSGPLAGRVLLGNSSCFCPTGGSSQVKSWN